jgi:serine/threonine protein kinase
LAACLKGYGAKVDVWALGVFTFMLLTGELPFEGEFFMQFEKAITLGEWRFAADDAAALSDEAQAFVAACLTYDPAQRQSAAAASQHVWLRTECCPAPPAALERAHTRAARLGKVLERRRGVEKLRRAKNLIKTLRKMQPVLASAPSGA